MMGRARALALAAMVNGRRRRDRGHALHARVPAPLPDQAVVGAEQEWDEAEQKRLIDKFYNCLNPGGYLFVGHAESLFGLTQKFRMVHENNGTAYQRLEVNS